MSYRNDHDAALARIDALETELSRARAARGPDDARAELDRIEAEIKRAREKRDRLRDEIEHGPKPKRRGWAIGVALLVIATAVSMKSIPRHEAVASDEAPRVVQQQPPPPTLPSPPTRTATRLIPCVGELDHAIAERAASSDTCIAQIRLATEDPVLGNDVHALLARWLVAEEQLAAARNPTTVAMRDQLAPEIRTVIIASFTR